MLAAQMVPMLWFRLAVLVVFCAFVAFQQMWLVAGFAAVLIVITGFQLAQALRAKKEQESRQTK